MSCLLPALGCAQAPELIHSLEEESRNKKQDKNEGHFHSHFTKPGRNYLLHLLSPG